MKLTELLQLDESETLPFIKKVKSIDLASATYFRLHSGRVKSCEFLSEILNERSTFFTSTSQEL